MGFSGVLAGLDVGETAGTDESAGEEETAGFSGDSEGFSGFSGAAAGSSTIFLPVVGSVMTKGFRSRFPAGC
jgi:hypothetical protein